MCERILAGDSLEGRQRFFAALRMTGPRVILILGPVILSAAKNLPPTYGKRQLPELAFPPLKLYDEKPINLSTRKES